MNIVQDLKNRARYRGLTAWQFVQIIGRLEREADESACITIALATENDELRQQLDQAGIDVSGLLDDRRLAQEEVARQGIEIQRMAAALNAWEAHHANQAAVTVPPAHRDIDPGDQPTEPTGINVRPLRALLAEFGPVIPVFTPGDASPAHVPAAGLLAQDLAATRPPAS